MRKPILLFFILISCKFLIAQTISLGTDNEYCPNVEYEFTVTLPQGFVSISATHILITQQPYAFNSNSTSFKFKGKFKDENIKQIIEVRYGQNLIVFWEYRRIKSLFYPIPNAQTSCGYFNPNITFINAPLCQIATINFSFSNIKWFTNFENPDYCFGSILDYEYQLPSGWKIGSSMSTGSNWIPGPSNVTITSDLQNGNGVPIRIRPRNICSSNLSNNSIPFQIPVSRPPINLPMTASPNLVDCGSVAPITFSIGNIQSVIGLSGFEWNLGSPNNWQYNGLPAPSIINTVTNSLSLTPLCGKEIVSPTANAIVSISGNTCNINVPKASVNIANPLMAIQGTQSLCSGSANYSVTGLPCNSNVTWTLSPSTGLAQLNTTAGAGVTLTKVNDGNVTLTASVSVCNNIYPVSLPIHLGAYGSSDYSLSINGSTTGQPLYWCPNQTYSFSLGQSPATNYNWSVPPGWQILSNNGYNIVLKSPSTPGASNQVSVTFTEPCGTIFTKQVSTIYLTNGCSGSSVYSISPNPASSSITISCISLQSYCNIAAVQITDLYGQVKSSQTWPYTNQQVQMPVGFLLPGTYIAKVYNGTQWYSVQFIKQ